MNDSAKEDISFKVSFDELKRTIEEKIDFNVKKIKEDINRLMEIYSVVNTSWHILLSSTPIDPEGSLFKWLKRVMENVKKKHDGTKINYIFNEEGKFVGLMFSFSDSSKNSFTEVKNDIEKPTRWVFEKVKENALEKTKEKTK